MKRILQRASIGVCVAAGLLASPSALAGKDLDAIKRARRIDLRRQHRAGRVFGRRQPGQAGRDWTWTICRAVAAAVLGDATKVRFAPLTAQQRFTALQSGEIDCCPATPPGRRRATPRWACTSSHHLLRRPGLHGAEEPERQERQALKGATVCVQSGTTTERNLTDFSRANKLNSSPWCSRSSKLPLAPTSRGRCQVYTTDASAPGVDPRQGSAEAGRSRHPARADLQGAAGAVGAPRRRRVLRHRPSGSLSRCSKPRNTASRRPTSTSMKKDSTNSGRRASTGSGHRGHRQAAGPGQGMGLPRHQGGGQLWRDVRAQRRPEDADRPAARHEQPVDQGRPRCTPRRCAEARLRAAGRPRRARRRSDVRLAPLRSTHDGSPAEERDWSLAQPRRARAAVPGGRAAR